MEDTKGYDLSFFMPGQAKETEVEERVISKRFRDNEGKVIPFQFKAITTERVEELEEECKKAIIRKNRVVGHELDSKRFNARIAIESTIYPNFKSKELREAYGTQDAVEIARKVLHLAGEYSEWVAEAVAINGFDDTVEDLEEEVKN